MYRDGWIVGIVGSVDPGFDSHSLMILWMGTSLVGIWFSLVTKLWSLYRRKRTSHITLCDYSLD